MGTVLVQGTMSTYNTIALLPKLDELGLNVKLVAAISPELFKLQPKSYQDSIISDADKVDMTYITTLARTSEQTARQVLSAEAVRLLRRGGPHTVATRVLLVAERVHGRIPARWADTPGGGCSCERM